MIFQVLSWLKYLWRAQGAHLLHSPFVFDLYTQVIRGDKRTVEPEIFRTELLNSKNLIRLVNIGAPSRVMKKKEVALRQIALSSLLPARYGNLLFRLAEHFKPKQILELGTSAGITTLYLSQACMNASVHTIEGNPDIAAVAAKIFTKSGAENIRLHLGLFKDRLPQVLEMISSPDFVFLDGDHRKVAVMENLRQLIPHMSEHAVLIIDDIHWSPDMEAAWTEIKQLEEVTVTIDLFRMGLVFFKKNQARQHFILRY